MNKKMLLIAVVGGLSYAQSTGSPVFEVASVKPSPSDTESGSSTINNGSLVVRNVALRACIATAYQVKFSEVQGPGWLDTERFDIVARAQTSIGEPAVLKMYQALLADRFKLQAHTGSKEVPGFALKIAKDGIKLKDVGAQRVSTPAPEPGRVIQRSNATHIVSQEGMTMTVLAAELSRRLSAPVVDMTGTSDYFAINLAFTLPDVTTGQNPDGVLDTPTGNPSLSTALQQQAGLRLESMRVTVPVVVVDSIERKPTEN